MRQDEPEDLVVGPRLEEGAEHRRVGLRAGVRLYVRVLGAEQLLRAIDRELLGDVDVAASPVVPARDTPPRTCCSSSRPARRAPRGSRSSRRRSGGVCRSRSSSPAIAPATSGSCLASRSQSATNPCAWSGISVLLVRSRRPAPIGARAARPRTACRARASGSPSRAGRRRCATHREDVRVVVPARQFGEVKVVAERRPGPADLVGRELLALPRPPSTIPRSAGPSTTARAAAAQKSR